MSKGIEVIDEKKQLDLVDYFKIKEAKNLLKSAKKIIILGFGFDKSNTDLLDLKSLSGCGKKIFYKNYSGHNNIKEKAEILFGSDAKEYQTNVFDVFENHLNL